MNRSPAGEFRVLEFAESPRAFHGREIPSSPDPELWWNRITEAALVLGSTQRDMSVVDVEACAAAGVDVVRRRSGGGAVLLVPGEVVWFDVIIPTGSVSSLGSDVHAPMQWLGGHLAEVLANGGASPALAREGRNGVAEPPNPEFGVQFGVHGPGMKRTTFSSLICFDGVGPGEVLLGGEKLVGISQRRTRDASRLQCCWYVRHDPARLIELLSPVDGLTADRLSPVAVMPIEDTAMTLSSLASSLSVDLAH